MDRILMDVLDEHAVDFQVIDREHFQIGERRQAAAEIIEGEL